LSTTGRTARTLLSLLCLAAASGRYGPAAPAQTGAAAQQQPPPDSTCEPETPNARRYKVVKVEPRLGEKISGYPKWKREMIMASGGDTRKSYDVRYGGINYTVGTHRTSDVIKWVSTHDPAFRTPEGIAAGDTLEKVRAVAETEVGAEPGWAYHARLPSGWSAAFVQGRYMTEGELSPTAKVCFLFKREP
jgi:hypothetical protein